MIERYAVQELNEIWSEENKFSTFLKVEIALLKAQEELNKIPQSHRGLSEKIKNTVKLDMNKIQEIEKLTRHDFIAFTESIKVYLTPDESKWFHFGATSSDVIDTALSLQIKASLEILISDIQCLRETLWEKAKQTSNLLALGRSHGMGGEGIIFGQKFLRSYAAISRCQDHLMKLKSCFTAKFTGALGNYTVLDFETEKRAADLLDLPVEPIASQVIPRDHICRLGHELAVLSGCLQDLAVEIRHLSREEVKEVSEGFSPGQKGSSTMPFKKNPVACENITGLTRVIQSSCTALVQNIPLWHERDISHSSVERVILPDILTLSVYVVRRMKNTLVHLEIFGDRIEDRVKNSPYVLGSFLLHQMIHTSHGCSREALYEVIQKTSFDKPSYATWEDYVLGVQLKAQQLFPHVNWQKQTVTFETLKQHYIKVYDQLVERVYNRYPLEKQKIL